MKDYYLFDLDGTLTNSGEGILRSVEYALRELHVPVPDRDALRPFIDYIADRQLSVYLWTESGDGAACGRKISRTIF